MATPILMANLDHLKPSIKKKWLKALRSGKYIQGQQKFYNTQKDTHCAFGVLLDVLHVPREGDNYIMRLKDETGCDYVAHRNGTMPLAWVSYRLRNYVNDWNDGTAGHDRAYTFDEMADMIDKEF
jgi:hypothetical protein